MYSVCSLYIRMIYMIVIYLKTDCKIKNAIPQPMLQERLLTGLGKQNGYQPCAHHVDEIARLGISQQLHLVIRVGEKLQIRIIPVESPRTGPLLPAAQTIIHPPQLV